MRSLLFSIVALLSFVIFVAGTPVAAPEPVPYRSRCGGNTIGFCPQGGTCTRGASGYSCQRQTFRNRPAGPSASARHHKRNIAFCEDSTVACPVPGELHGFECVNVQTDLEQCGDCHVLGGVDCSMIPGVSDVACVNGYCRVEGCTSGYVFDFRRRSCVPHTFWNIQPRDQQEEQH